MCEIRARSEIDYIAETTGKRYKHPSPEEYNHICEKYNIPKGASSLVLGVSYSLGQQCEKAGNTEAANYFYGIYYAIAKDNEIKNKLDNSAAMTKEKKKPFWKR